MSYHHPVPRPPRRLTRSRNERVLAGVCGGIANYLNMDPSLVRILVALVTVLGSGIPLILYVIAILVVPEDDRVGPPPGPRPAVWPPVAAPGPAPQDPIWGREGAPWEQPQPSGGVPPQTDGPSDPPRPDPR